MAGEIYGVTILLLLLHTVVASHTRSMNVVHLPICIYTAAVYMTSSRLNTLFTAC